MRFKDGISIWSKYWLNIALPTTATTTTTTATAAAAATTTTTAPSLLQLLLPDALRRMSVNVEVGLLSGMAVAVEAGLDETVATSKRRLHSPCEVIVNDTPVRSVNALIIETFDRSPVLINKAGAYADLVI